MLRPMLNDEELAEIEKKYTTGANDIHMGDILDDDDLRNVICDLLHTIRVLTNEAPSPDAPEPRPTMIQ